MNIKGCRPNYKFFGVIKYIKFIIYRLNLILFIEHCQQFSWLFLDNTIVIFLYILTSYIYCGFKAFFFKKEPLWTFCEPLKKWVRTLSVSLTLHRQEPHYFHFFKEPQKNLYEPFLFYHICISLEKLKKNIIKK